MINLLAKDVVDDGATTCIYVDEWVVVVFSFEDT